MNAPRRELPSWIRAMRPDLTCCHGVPWPCGICDRVAAERAAASAAREPMPCAQHGWCRNTPAEMDEHARWYVETPEGRAFASDDPPFAGTAELAGETES